MRNLVTVIVAGVLLAGCGGAEPEAAPEPAPTSEVTEEPAPEPEPEPSPEPERDAGFKLAAIDTGTTDPSTADVTRYRDALDAADDKCSQDATLVGDMAVRATQLAADEGIEASIMDMLVAMEGAVPDDLAPMDCAEIAAGLLTIMGSG